MATTNDYFPESDDYVYFITALLCCLLVNALNVIQFRNVYLDLFTTKRTSISHRKSVPKVTALYKSVNLMTWFCVFCYAMTGILEVVKQGHSRKCHIEFYIVMVFFNWSKSALFSVYLLRLQSTYGDTRYAYPKCIIYALFALQWLFGIALPIICNVFSTQFVYDNDGFPDPCWGVFVHWNVIWLIAWDFGMNSGCLIAFIWPLYRTWTHSNRATRQRQETASTSRQLSHSASRSSSATSTVAGFANAVNAAVESERKLVKQTAIKVTVLTATASVTTIIALMAFTVFGFAHIFPFDWVVNSVCVMLMSPYYNVCSCTCFQRRHNVDEPDVAGSSKIDIVKVEMGTNLSATCQASAE